MNNMDLWQRVYRTDPNQVKEIKGKAYKGVSPKPYWLIEQATKEFGACGQGWGVEVLRSDFQQISPTDFLHTAIVRVWYMRDGVKCAIEQAGGTKASYLSKDKILIVDEDAAKKSITDGMVKCLSMIGFAGDIFSGRWDDSKYLLDVEKYFEDEKQKAKGLITKEQEASILVLAREVNADIPRMANYYGCKFFTELKTEMFDVIIAALEERRK